MPPTPPADCHTAGKLPTPPADCPHRRQTAIQLSAAIINFCQDLNERLPPCPGLPDCALPPACVSNLRLQAMLYVIQLRSLQLHGHAGRILDEDFEAWSMGPVLGSVYQTYRHYGAERIYDRQRGDPALPDAHAYLGSLIEKTALAMPFALIRLTRGHGGAWHQTRSRHERIITPELMAREAASLPNLSTMHYASLFAALTCR